MEEQKIAANKEVSTAKAKELAEKLRSLLRESMAKRGGSEAFLHWLRSGDDSGN